MDAALDYHVEVRNSAVTENSSHVYLAAKGDPLVRIWANGVLLVELHASDIMARIKDHPPGSLIDQLRDQRITGFNAVMRIREAAATALENR